uniref:NADH dehydrogenase subunit 6 n=1 Tax=Ptosima chinensis TaxID=3025998 RepID=UPI0023AA8E6F|nr:NADH dehydrogenase subunit 6 [Ptosima chinensis]WCO87663.1 NADH dehydrogenase subunit 6 [Ptosima chinensis]
MMLVLQTTTIMISLIFTMVNHPLSMGFTLLVQSIIIAMITGIAHYNFWFSYVLFLIMVGGLLVLFIYMTSIASNEKFSYSNKITSTLMIILVVSLAWLNFNDLFFNYMDMIVDTEKWGTNENWENSFTKYFSFPTSLIMAMLIIYLFIALIAIVKITEIKHGPLRQKF